MKHIYQQYHKYRSLVIIKVLLFGLLITSCEDFADIDPPNNQLTGEVVFEDARTIEATLIHIYNQLRDNAFTTGDISGVGFLLGHYADELDLYSTSLSTVQQFYDNSLLASNSSVSSLWSGSYNLIYAANNIIEGIENSTSLSDEDRDRFLGEAYFLRGFIHFYMVTLYGNIPYIDATDYRINSEVSRLSEVLVYEKIVDDLILSKSLLSENYTGLNRVRPNKWVVAALLARVYLYGENWEMAKNEALQVISSGSYSLNTNLDQVFLKNSMETLWQYDPAIQGFNTQEAQLYIFVSGPPPRSALTSEFIDSFETSDARYTEWVGVVSDGTNTWFYPYKYKLITNTGTTEEYSIVFRLSEMYLIVAEAHTQIGNLSEALDYLNAIRNRASLAPITTINQNNILNAILQERRIEFFTEQGHRFFDLKRTGQADNELSLIKSNWETTDMLLPIPESELILNPNLEPQNDGY
jgi:starch-binding outer membrane protein, SusD/RagB family